MSQIGNPDDDKVLAAPIQLGAHNEYRKAIQSYFPKGLPADWGFMYHQTKIDHDEKFLCSNWAGYRVKQDLAVGQEYPFAKEHPVATDDYSVGEQEDLLAKLDLWDATKKKLKFIEQCDATDPARELASKCLPSQTRLHIGHISVKWNGRWEGKLSNEFYVITHSGESFRRYDIHQMYPAVYYKQTKKA